MNEKVTLLLKKYRDELTKMNITAKQCEDQVGFPGVRGLEDEAIMLRHILWMVYTMLAEAPEEQGSQRGWNDRKINRWLGFIQGTLWSTKLRGILELREEARDLY